MFRGRGPRGYDGAKKLVGRKRKALVNAEGHILALAVVAATVQDRDTLPALDDGKKQWPSLRLAILDGAFTAERCSDKGPEFVAKVFQSWITGVGAKTAYVTPGSLCENGYFENLNALLRDELLNGKIFHTLK